MTPKRYLLLAFLLSTQFLQAQVYKVLHGTSFRGGENNTGTLFYQTPEAPSSHTFISFDKVGPLSPFGALTLASDGQLYASSAGGGNFNHGTIIRMGSNEEAPTILHHFNKTSDAAPRCTLIEGSDGKLYGTTYEGGSAESGTVFSLGKDGAGFAILHEFTGSDGSSPWAGIMEGSDGQLYGTTESGGNAFGGVLFKIKKDGSGFTVLRHFGHCGF